MWLDRKTHGPSAPALPVSASSGIILSKQNTRRSLGRCSVSGSVSRIGGLLAVEGQPDFKAGFARAGFKFNFAAMAVADDAGADDQAQVRASAERLGGEIRLEHVGLDILGITGTIVHAFEV